MSHTSLSKLLAPALAAMALAGAACAQEAAPRILEDGGPSHHHALHAQNPILARYKGLYPRRVLLTVEDTGAQYTILNEGPRFEVAEGAYGTANLLITMESAAIEQVYEMVKTGSMPEGQPRIDMAKLVREFSEASVELPQFQDPNPSGPGPALDKFSAFLANAMDTKVKGLDFMAKAGAAKAAGKKLATLYFGLRSKLLLKKADKLSEKGAGILIKELGKDLAEGRMDITPGGTWSVFVDLNCFYGMVRSQQHFGPMCESLVQRLQGLLVYHKTLPPTPELATRSEIIAARLELVKQLLELIDV